MALTLDVDPKDGDLLIRGSADELQDFAQAIIDAVEDEEPRVIGTLLTSTGVEDVRVEIDPG